MSILCCLPILAIHSKAATWLSDWAYKLYYPNSGAIVYSKYPIYYGNQDLLVSWSGKAYSGSYVGLEDAINAGTYSSSAGTYSFTGLYSGYTGTSSVSPQIHSVLLIPVDNNGNIEYEVILPSLFRRVGASGVSPKYAYYNTLLSSSYNYWISGIPQGYSGTSSISTSGSFPSDIGSSGLTEDDVNALIEEKLEEISTITTYGQQANNLSASVEYTASEYEAGNITTAQAETELKAYQAQIQTISETAVSSGGGTIADLIAINNAQNNVDILQDQILADKEIAADREIWEEEKQFWETRDISQDVADNAQHSWEDEKNFVESIAAETGSIDEYVQAITPNATEEQAIQTVVTGLWENPLLSRIITVAAVLMVISVVIGVKYQL